MITNQFKFRKNTLYEVTLEIDNLPKLFDEKLKAFGKICNQIEKNFECITGPAVSRSSIISNKEIPNGSGEVKYFIGDTSFTSKWKVVKSSKIIPPQNFYQIQWGLKIYYGKIISRILRGEELKQENQFYWDSEDNVLLDNTRYQMNIGFQVRIIIDQTDFTPYIRLYRATSIIGKTTLYGIIQNEVKLQGLDHWSELDFDELNKKLRSAGRTPKFRTTYTIEGSYGDPFRQRFTFDRIENRSITDPGSAGIPNDDTSLVEYQRLKYEREVDDEDQPIVILKSRKEIPLIPSLVEETADLNTLKRESFGSASKQALKIAKSSAKDMADEISFFKSLYLEDYLSDFHSKENHAGPIYLKNNEKANSIEIKKNVDYTDILNHNLIVPTGYVYILYAKDQEEKVKSSGIVSLFHERLNLTGWRHDEIVTTMIEELNPDLIREKVLEFKFTPDDILIILQAPASTNYFGKKTYDGKLYNTVKKEISGVLKIPVQFFEITPDNLSNKIRFVIPQLVVKAGGIPYKITNTGLPSSIIIGLDKYRDSRKINPSISGSASVFSKDGVHIGSSTTDLTADVTDEIHQLKELIEDALKFKDQMEEEIENFIVLRDGGRGTNTSMYEEESQIIEKILANHNLNLVYVLVNKNPKIRLFKGSSIDDVKGNPEPFTYTILENENKFTLVTTDLTGGYNKKDESASPQPLEYEIMTNTTSFETSSLISLLATTISGLCVAVYESYKFTRLPSPLHYAHELSKMAADTQMKWSDIKRPLYI